MLNANSYQYDVFHNNQFLGRVLASDEDDATAEAMTEWGDDLEYEVILSEGGY